jgi:hypothetical protein
MRMKREEHRMDIQSFYHLWGEDVSEEVPDLIVIATQGQTALNNLIFGSVSEKLVRLASCPVMTIHGSTAATPEAPKPR